MAFLVPAKLRLRVTKMERMGWLMPDGPLNPSNNQQQMCSDLPDLGLSTSICSRQYLPPVTI